jgi:predicted nucleotidyltransferase
MFEKKYLTPLEQELLRYLSLRPGSEFHLRDLSRATGRSVSGSHTALGRLEISELVTSRVRGRNRYFRVTDDPSIRFFKVFMNATEALSIIRPFLDDIQKATLYGSCSRGEDTFGSDVDMFILSSEKELRKLLPRTLNDRPVDYRVVSSSEMILLRKSDPGYLNEVEKGIELWRVEVGPQ